MAVAGPLAAGIPRGMARVVAIATIIMRILAITQTLQGAAI